MRIAIASGPAIVGNVGAPGRFNYTALGAPVNLAARLEATSKAYGVDILVDAATRAGAGDALRFVEIDAVLLKGKAAPVAAFALLLPGTGDNAPVDAYAAALAAARAGDTGRAIEAFTALARQEGSALAAPARRVLDNLRASTAT